MFDTFEKETRMSERRALRLKQMRLMEEASSGLISTTDAMGASSSPPHRHFKGIYSIEDIDEDDMGPPRVFTSPPPASHPSGGGSRGEGGGGGTASGVLVLDAEKLSFITGDGVDVGGDDCGGDAGGGGGMRRWGIGRVGSRLASMSRSGTRNANTKNNGDRHRNDGGGAGDGYEYDDEEDATGGNETMNVRSSSPYSTMRSTSTKYVRVPAHCATYRREYLALVMLSTLLLLLLVAVLPSRNGNASNDAESWTHAPWDGNDGQYALPLDVGKFDRIKDRILERGISHGSSLELSYTAQHRALVWLVRDDPRMLDVPRVSDDGNGNDRMSGAEIDMERVVFQRYALAVLWFMTTDVDIVRMSTTDKNVLDPFDKPYNAMDLTADDVKWKEDENWMTGMGLCMWHGVTCHQRRHVDDTSDAEDGMYMPDMSVSMNGTDVVGGGRYDGDYYVSDLNLTNNNLHGILPREVYTAFEKLTSLDLSRNLLEGTIGMEIGRLLELEDLFLHDNNFSGDIPHDVGKLTKLYNFYINDNEFRGNIPWEMGGLINLRGASMFNNTLRGNIPETLGNLKHLIALYLDENELSGQIPTSLGHLSSMMDLRLRVNKFTGSIPTELGNLTQLETLYLDTNPSIGGTIPPELSNLVRLNELHLYQMELTGSLPSELGLLNGLVYLYLDSNDLTGTIPDEWGQMRDLEELFLTDNDLSGRLPITMRGMTSLHTLRAAGNQLTGPIPSDLGKMMKLEYVYLEGNDFSGKVPSQLGQLTKLKLLHLHDNNLTGMSEAVCELSVGFLLRDLTADCDDMVCTCCTCPP